jgi:crossover junction endodeoxyribonuclease RuvC
MPDCVVGIDPGLRGGLACVLLSGEVVMAETMPVFGSKPRTVDGITLARWVGEVHDLLGGGEIALAVVEKAQYHPGQQGRFEYGVGYGTILGVLIALGVPIDLASPAKWQNAILGRRPKGSDPKAAALAYAARRFPGVALVPPGCRTPHDGIGDALCLAEFARRLALGEIRS